uniref:Cwf21 domain-containing protein n=1 Tax=Anisakis simplex TaxID=6269 RepID=A0A0M3JKP5_ANISI
LQDELETEKCEDVATQVQNYRASLLKKMEEKLDALNGDVSSKSKKHKEKPRKRSRSRKRDEKSNRERTRGGTDGERTRDRDRDRDVPRTKEKV